jgi:hypothetical protein
MCQTSLKSFLQLHGVAAAELHKVNSQHSNFLLEKAANTPCINAKEDALHKCKIHRIAKSEFSLIGQIVL